MKILSLLCALCICATAQAQLGFGLEAGLNCGKDAAKIAGDTKKTTIRYGMRLGGLADIALSNKLYLQPGLYYVANGYKDKFTGGTEEYSINTIEIPAYLTYKFDNIGSGRLFVGAGPFMAITANGYYHIQAAISVDSKSDLKIGSGAGDEVRNLDFGLGANVGYQLPAGLFVRVRAQMGLKNMSPQSDENNYLRSVNFGFSIGYIFYRTDSEGRMIMKKHREKRKDRNEERTNP